MGESWLWQKSLRSSAVSVHWVRGVAYSLSAVSHSDLIIMSIYELVYSEQGSSSVLRSSKLERK